jgi:hypothetical protein
MRFRAHSVAAASLLPPPAPPPTGCACPDGYARRERPRNAREAGAPRAPPGCRSAVITSVQVKMMSSAGSNVSVSWRPMVWAMLLMSWYSCSLPRTSSTRLTFAGACTVNMVSSLRAAWQCGYATGVPIRPPSASPASWWVRCPRPTATHRRGHVPPEAVAEGIAQLFSRRVEPRSHEIKEGVDLRVWIWVGIRAYPAATQAS